MRPDVRRWLSTTVVALALATAAVAVAPAAHADSVTYERTAYSDTVYRVTVRTSADGSPRFASRFPLTPSLWRQAGYPAPTTVPSSYERLPWSSTVVARSTFGGVSVYAEAITAPQWASVGYPAVGLVSADYHRFEGSLELFGWSAQTQYVKLAPAQWALAGYPAPVDEPVVFARYAWSSRIFLVDVDTWSGAQLSFDEWAVYAYPTPVTVEDGAFVQFPGEEAIFHVDGDLEFQVTYDEWAAAGYPTPQQVEE